jgi:DNA-directed RNA polymerase specialized sigma24 family protein
VENTMQDWVCALLDGRAEEGHRLLLHDLGATILTWISRAVPDPDDAMDTYAFVGEALAAHNFRRLRRVGLLAAPERDAKAWLAVVVRRLVLDWVRSRNGRPHRAVPRGLSPLAQMIYRVLYLRLGTVTEAYEQARATGLHTLPFGPFLREVREVERRTRRWRQRERSRVRRGTWQEAELISASQTAIDRIVSEESLDELAGCLNLLQPEIRRSVELFVVQGLPAAEVARLLGWPGPKSVYNRVGRALRRLRALLKDRGGGGSAQHG